MMAVVRVREAALRLDWVTRFSRTVFEPDDTMASVQAGETEVITSAEGKYSSINAHHTE